MSTDTESRLKDALTAVGASLGSADVPLLQLETRRRAVRPRTMAVAGAGLAAIAVIGTVVMVNPFATGRTTAPVMSSPSRSATKVLVFLCVRSSANLSCNHSGATPVQKNAIVARLKETPGVMSFSYESQSQALARFKRSTKADTASVQLGDIPDSYQVTFSNLADASHAEAVLGRMPGVDQVITEPRR